MLFALKRLFEPVPIPIAVVPCKVAAFVTVSVPAPDNPGTTIEPLPAVRLPRTVPVPPMVCPLLRVNVLSPRPLASRIVPEARLIFGLLEIEPLLVNAIVPAANTVLPV